jgi:hypothetical protein
MVKINSFDSFPLGFDFAQKSPKRITPLFLFLHTALYLGDSGKHLFSHDENWGRN